MFNILIKYKNKKMDSSIEGIKLIYECLIKDLLQLIEKGNFPLNISLKAFMKAQNEIYKMANDYNNSAEQLFNYYIKVITEYVNNAYNKIKCLSDDELINHFLDEYSKCIQLIYWMQRIFIYLDKFYTKNKNKGSLFTNSFKIFEDKMFVPLKEKLYEEVNKMINKDRNNFVINRIEIKNILRIIQEINMVKPVIIKENEELICKGEYTNNFIIDWFDNYFKKSTEEFIKMKAQNDIRTKSGIEYIKSSLKYLKEEKERENEYIDKMFWNVIDSINNKALIEDNVITLQKMDTGILFILKSKKNDEIKELYTLLSICPDYIKVINDEFELYINERFEKNELIKNPLIFIRELIKIKKEMDSLIQNAFDNCILFHETKNKIFSFYMNKKKIYSKQLSIYTDYMMKKGIKSLNESQIEDALNDIIDLFKFLNSKLLFQLETNILMSDRLIQNESLSLITEKKFIKKLQNEEGIIYVNKMNEMIRDSENSKIEIDLYRQQKHNGKPNGIEFNIQIVSKNAWEISKNKMDKLEIPKILENCMKDFNDFYIARHKNRKLIWCYGLGNIEIQYLSLQKQYFSISTLCQYTILCNLEKYGKLTIEKIINLLGYDINIILEDVSALVYNTNFNKTRDKNKGLIKGNFKDEIKISDEIEFNEEFNNNIIKFNTIPYIRENKEKELEEKIFKKRNKENYLQSFLIKIIKSNNKSKITYDWLISEVSQIELFTTQQIKENIEKLIEKGIIKKSDKDNNCYEYIDL